MSPTGGEGWRYGTGFVWGMSSKEDEVFEEEEEEEEGKEVFGASQWSKGTRVLFRGTSMSIMKRM
jgi:hypothetical protein